MKFLFYNENVFDNENITPKDGESEKKKINSENVIDSIDNQRNTDESASIQNGDCYHNNQKYPKIFSNGTF